MRKQLKMIIFRKTRSIYVDFLDFVAILESLSHLSLYTLNRFMIYEEKDHLSYFQMINIAFEYLEENLISAPILAIYLWYEKGYRTAMWCQFTRVWESCSYTKTDWWNIIYFIPYHFSLKKQPLYSLLETLAIIYALRIYLKGILFEIVTYCNSLTMTLRLKTLSPGIGRSL